MRNIEKIFKSLADRNRIRILKMLEVRRLCVCEITAIMGIAQPSVSRHLSILRDAGLV
ncbi:MAG: metalloregulator ArsR/SmtB family transcription factor, partial [Candidatus Aureabacteria bacterium]|nr:metalloregulator ArsR/SmtB family transcription factor [Candidatus Auribacterota bacterium]